MHNFILIGAAGYIAPRHMQAIKETGNTLLAAYDPFDSVGIIDSYFPDADFFTEFERFDRHVDKLRRKGIRIDYVSICSPNYLHDAHIRFALRIGANAICEKPLVLNPWNVDALTELENECSGKIYNILQLRLHPSVIALKERFDADQKTSKPDIRLHYITSRGKWYHHSWKGDIQKSGGIATNIGIHFFDMLLWIFGDVRSLEVHQHDDFTARGILELEKARVDWLLSVDEKLLPDNCKNEGKRTFRAIEIGDENFEFSTGFTDLHTASYKHILSGDGFRTSDVKKSIELAAAIRKYYKQAN